MTSANRSHPGVTPGALQDEPTLVLRHGGATAEVALLGATVLRWVVDLGDGPSDLLDGYRTADELRGQDGIRNAVMAPYCDRVSDARYTFDGIEHDLAPGSADRLVYHGSIRSTPFTLAAVREHEDALVVTLRCDGLVTSPPAGYPFAVDVEVTYRLGATCLGIEIAAHNVGPVAAPFACGWHPYLRLPGATTIADLELEVPADTRVETDLDLIPLPGPAAYAPLARRPRWSPLGDVVLDVSYVAQAHPRSPSVLRDPTSGVQVTLTQDRGLVHLFTGDTLTRDRRASIAVEPVESMTDAFNRPDGAAALRLEPGERRAFAATLTVSRATAAPDDDPGVGARTTGAPATAPHPHVVVMGVSGCGKSTVGAALAARLGLPFVDADDLHPAANVAKMAAGVPLDDEDRAPWLRAVGAWLADHPHGAVVACSALRRTYRDVLRAAAPGADFLHLAGDPSVVARRVGDRPGHFMPTSLVASQVATLEPLGADERGVAVDLGLPVPTIVEAFVASRGQNSA